VVIAAPLSSDRRIEEKSCGAAALASGLRRLPGAGIRKNLRLLRAQIGALLARVTPPAAPGMLRALVLPHAGLGWSGATAAAGWARVADPDFERVVILAPSHTVPLRGAAADPSSDYETPLGRVAVDAEALQRLEAAPQFTIDARPFQREHAIEMQLPFLQMQLATARLVPILVGALRDDDSEAGRGGHRAASGCTDAARRQQRFHALRRRVRLRAVHRTGAAAHRIPGSRSRHVAAGR
jgi:hypothetical protein